MHMLLLRRESERERERERERREREKFVMRWSQHKKMEVGINIYKILTASFFFFF